MNDSRESTNVTDSDRSGAVVSLHRRYWASRLQIGSLVQRVTKDIRAHFDEDLVDDFDELRYAASCRSMPEAMLGRSSEWTPGNIDLEPPGATVQLSRRQPTSERSRPRTAYFCLVKVEKCPRFASQLRIVLSS